MIAVMISPDDTLTAIRFHQLLRQSLPDEEFRFPAPVWEAIQGRQNGVGDSPASAPNGNGSHAEKHESGAAPADAERPWLAEAELILVPNPCAYVWPALSYAMIRGIPIVAAGTDYAAELIGTGGLILSAVPSGTEVAEAIRELRENPERRSQLVRAGREWMRNSLKRAAATANGKMPDAVPKETSSAPPSALLELPRRAVSVIIPTRGGDRVARCIRAVRKAAGDLPIQVICVVTGGLTGSLPPCDEVVRAEPPFVWSKANNAGLKVATYPYVLILNDDCYFKRAGDLARLVDRLETCAHLTAVGPRGTGFPDQWHQTTLPARTGLHEIRFTLSGACFLARKEAFCAVGGFDERFETYGCDEVDWFYRARRQGYRWAVDTNVSVEHEVHGTFGDRPDRELGQSMRLFRTIHGVHTEDGPHWDPPRCELSWVIASRNNAGHLARCLGSIAGCQHLFPKDMEVVLALDGCTDHSRAVAEQFNASLDYPLPLRIVEFREPAGSAARAKNRAIRLALGDVHLPMDDDDCTLPARVKLVAALSDDVDVTVGNYWQLGMDGSLTEKRPGPFEFEAMSGPAGHGWGPWATAIRRETWARYGLHAEDRTANEDLELWLRWLRDGVRFRYVDVPVHLYMLRPGSVVGTHRILKLREEIQTAYRSGRGAPPMGLQSVR